jgi:hypothetical protein
MHTVDLDIASKEHCLSRLGATQDELEDDEWPILYFSLQSLLLWLKEDDCRFSTSIQRDRSDFSADF